MREYHRSVFLFLLGKYVESEGKDVSAKSVGNMNFAKGNINQFKR